MADSTLSLPRLLCLHGAGSNAIVFQSQCRSLIPLLTPYFRLCFVDGPVICEPTPDVSLVYEEFAPFRLWLPWHLGALPLGTRENRPQVADVEAYELIEKPIADAMRADDAKGATGEWVGLLGFSQGAKLCASLLYRQQERAKHLGEANAGSKFRFAVLMCGPAPIVVFESFAGSSVKPVLRMPTLHVHALKDPHLPYHRMMRNEYCEKKTARLIEWNGPHRVPLAAKDVKPVAEQIIRLAKDTGALRY